MSDITVLRVEISSAGVNKEGSLESGAGKSSTGTSLAAGAVAGKASSGGFRDKLREEVIKFDEANLRPDGNSSMGYGRAASRMARLNERKQAIVVMTDPDSMPYERKLHAKQYLKNISAPTYKQTTTAVSAAAALGTQAFSMYSNYQKAGYEMSGATHQAAVQGRKAAIGGFATSVSVAALINPLAAAGMIAMKAYQLAQTNRKELFEIRKSVIQSTILQRNLVNNIVESRF